MRESRTSEILRLIAERTSDDLVFFILFYFISFLILGSFLFFFS